MASDAQATATHDLCIVGGLHAGADTPLRRLGSLVVGSARECDVCVSDDGVAAYHLLLRDDGRQVRVRPLGGDVALDGRALARGKSAAFAAGATLALSGSDVTFALAAASAQAAPERGRWRTVRALFVAAVSVTAFVAAGAVFQIRATGIGDPPPDTLALSLAAVTELGLDGRVSVDDDTPEPVLRGVVTQDERQQLEARLAQLGIDPSLRITTIAELLARVREVFRTNGYSVELDFTAPATVRVTNLDQANPAIARVAEHVRRDVPALRDLTFAPAQAASAPPTQPELYTGAPGKRLTTIVDGSTAYVAAEDGSRYFVGSVLPGGVYVRQITADGVQVDRDGVLTWLRF